MTLKLKVFDEAKHLNEEFKDCFLTKVKNMAVKINNIFKEINKD